MRKYLIAVRAIVVSAATGAAVLLGTVQANGEDVFLAERNTFAESNVEMRLQQLEAELASFRGAGSACGHGACAPYAACCHSGLGWPTGFYIGLSGGPQSRKRADDVGLGTAAEFHTGFGVSGMLGHRFRNNLRTEFEFSFLDNNNKTFIVFDDGVPVIEDPSSGHVSLRSFMANLYYDVPVENWFPALWRFRPYVGAGIGTTESRINGFTSPLLSGMLGDQGFAPTVLDVASEFTYSWQVRVGVSYLLTNNAEFYAGWRHFETDDLQFNTIPPRDVLPAQQEFGQFGVIDVTGANIDMAEFGLRVFF